MSKHDKAAQLKVSGRIKETGQGTEMAVVQFTLGDLLKMAKEQGVEDDGTVLILQNIPEEGKNRAPGYVRLLKPDQMGRDAA